MMLAGFLFLLLLTGGTTSTTEQPDLQATTEDTEPGGTTSTTEQPDLQATTEDTEPDFKDTKKCSYDDVINHLKLNQTNSLLTLSRPVKDFMDPTIVYIQFILYAILDVRESDQSFIPYVWISMEWSNDHIEWDEKRFCGIKRIIVPTELLWKPDITIKEITEKEKTPPSPYLLIESDGWVKYRSDQVLISTCGMQVYKFPFDTQRCNLSFRSIMHSDEEISFNTNPNIATVTAWSHAIMANHSEWRLLSITPNKITVNNFGLNHSTIVYTISMQRRPVLYLVSFILPVVFFLCLDFASFLISDTGGEKLSFKITVLLAITVMQLILNEILPSSSDRIPLIAVYCIGIFTMMLLSLLETIVVMYLLQKDPAEQFNKDDEDRSLSEDCTDRQSESRVRNKWTFCVCDADEPPTQALPENEGSSNKTEVSRTLEKVSDDLRKMEKTISLFSNGSKKEGRKLYWIRVTKRINKVFFVCYVTATVVFLIIIFTLWLTDDNE
ncbi:5-hydroxytryptamine receptor 3A-like [Betta splendens]|uniref:5-hydroxytryptamine receptor 3A-like n=1 Tax=Betta splendens TaxID=158456 RepID=A0A6P7LC03_BETSP|nr:5-hydroxytryptamine receptor 3A-like [Betta splendens]